MSDQNDKNSDLNNIIDSDRGNDSIPKNVILEPQKAKIINGISQKKDIYSSQDFQLAYIKGDSKRL